MIYSTVRTLARRWPLEKGRDRMCRILMRHPQRLKRLIADAAEWADTRAGFPLRVMPGDDFVSNAIRIFGNFEPDTEAHILERVPKNGGFCDIGANVGYFSLNVALQRPDSRVLALEPNPPVAACIRESAVRNQCSDRVRVEQLAVSDQTGSLPFLIEPEDTGYSRLATEAELEQAVQIPVIRWDDWFSESQPLQRVDCLKMDIEGAEMLALRGMRSFLEEHHPCLIVEAYDDRLCEFGGSRREMEGFLQDLGYHEARPYDGNVYFDPR